MGAIDLHFHGAFGLDVMTATPEQLDALSLKLWQAGVAGFCPTTVSTRYEDLKAAIARIGEWISSREKSNAPGARPLGIHLEGPYIHPHACGAHPKEAIRTFSMTEIIDLWEASHHHLKILTIAPEGLDASDLSQLTSWAKKNKVILSLGHSRATAEQAEAAFAAGFSNVTHAWNALPFHHRTPGPLGAAFGRKRTYIELILDGIHVAPTIVRWTRALHPADQLCFVSDCVPAAETDKDSWHAFGPLHITYKDGACRLSDGSLAGGGHLVTELYRRWILAEAASQKRPIGQLVKESLPSLVEGPLAALGLSPARFKDRRVAWKVGRSDLQLTPLVGAGRARNSN